MLLSTGSRAGRRPSLPCFRSTGRRSSRTSPTPGARRKRPSGHAEPDAPGASARRRLGARVSEPPIAVDQICVSRAERRPFRCRHGPGWVRSRGSVLTSTICTVSPEIVGPDLPIELETITAISEGSGPRRRRRAVARSRRPVRAACGRGRSSLEALERGRCCPAAQAVELPPLGTPEGDRRSDRSVPVADHEVPACGDAVHERRRRGRVVGRVRVGESPLTVAVFLTSIRSRRQVHDDLDRR